MHLPQPAYQLTCVNSGYNTGCGWVGRFYFDDPLPGRCNRCGKGPFLKLESLTINQPKLDMSQPAETPF